MFASGVAGKGTGRRNAEVGPGIRDLRGIFRIKQREEGEVGSFPWIF